MVRICNICKYDRTTSMERTITLLIVVYCLMYASEGAYVCPVGFTIWLYKCFYISSDVFDWSRANAQCRWLGSGMGPSYLVEIDNKIINDYLKWQLDGKSYWIGMMYHTEKNMWVWWHSQRLVNQLYTNWRAGEPINDEILQCGVMYPEGTWGGIECSNKRHYICESDAVYWPNL